MKVTYKDEVYDIRPLNKNAKIYMGYKFNNAGVAIIYYDESTKTAKQKKYNYNNFGMNLATTKAIMFLKELSNLDRDMYGKIVNVYKKKITEEMLSVLKTDTKKKNTFKVD